MAAHNEAEFDRALTFSRSLLLVSLNAAWITGHNLKPDISPPPPK